MARFVIRGYNKSNYDFDLLEDMKAIYNTCFNTSRRLCECDENLTRYMYIFFPEYHINKKPYLEWKFAGGNELILYTKRKCKYAESVIFDILSKMFEKGYIEYFRIERD